MRVQIVSFHCVLKNKLGHLISSSFNQDVITTPNEDEPALLPEFVEALRLLKNGERRKISINADRAYGLYLPELVVTLSRKRLSRGAKLKKGDVVQGRLPSESEMRPFRVDSCSSTHVTLDANHPLAGQDLIFDVEMVSSREEVEPSFAPPANHDARLLC